MPPVLSTSLVDSIAADTVVPHILTEEQAEVLRFEAMVDSIESKPRRMPPRLIPAMPR